MAKTFCKIDVTETGNPEKPFKFDVFLDGDLIKQLSPIFVDEVVPNQLTQQPETIRVSCLKEAYFWLNTITKNIAVHDGLFSENELANRKIPNLFAKDLT